MRGALRGCIRVQEGCLRGAGKLLERCLTCQSRTAQSYCCLSVVTSSMSTQTQDILILDKEDMHLQC